MWRAGAFRSSPGLVIGIVLMLAIGLTAAATFISLTEDLFLAPPVGIASPQAARVLSASILESGSSGIGFDEEGFAALEELEAYTVLAAFSGLNIEPTVGSGLEAQKVNAELVSGRYFEALGASAIRGRLIEPRDDQPASEPVVVVSKSFYTTSLRADPSVLGRDYLSVDGRNYLVVGVAPAGFTGATRRKRDIWLPIAVAAETSFPLSRSTYTVRWLALVGRLDSGWTQENADELATAVFVASGVERVAPDRTWAVESRSLLENVRQGAADRMLVLRWLAAVSLAILMIAILNASVFFLVRNLDRQRELAIRSALGGTKRRLFTRLLGEALLLAGAATTVAMYLSILLGDVARAALRTGTTGNPGLSAAVLLSVASMALLAAAVGASIVAALLLRRDPSRALLTPSWQGMRAVRLRTVLLAAQVAMSTVLIVSASQFLTSLKAVHSLNVGVSTDDLWIVRWQEEESATEEPLRSWERAVRALKETPGVAHAALGGGDPFRWSITTGIEIPGRDLGEEGIAHARPVGENYHRAVGLQLLSGRWFEKGDHSQSASSAVLSRTMAERYWPDGNALGECFQAGEATPCYEILGIVADVVEYDPTSQQTATFYSPVEQRAVSWGQTPPILVRSTEASGMTSVQLRRALSEALPNLRYVEAVGYRAAMAPIYRDWTLGSALFSVYGAIALALAAAGLFASLSFDISRRRFELSVRQALGATPGAITAAIVRRGLAPVIFGLVFGVPAAWMASTLYEARLFGVLPSSPMPYVAGGLVLLATAVLVCLAPARQAARRSPTTMLRHL